LAHLSSLFSAHGPHRELHSFPTRRSSDLAHDGLTLGAQGSQEDGPLHLGAGDRDLVVDPAEVTALHPERRQATAVAALDPRSHRSEEHTSELQSPCNLVCRLLLEKKKKQK